MGTTNAPVIFLEFNELTPSLMTRFMHEGHLPNFSAFHQHADVYITDAGESPGTGRLNPWVQWVTIHSGLPTDQHGIFKLSDGHKLQSSRIWDVVAEAGKKTWVCGSMNAFFNRDPHGMILPDPWSEKVKPYPEKLFDAYYHFVRTQVQEHTNKKVPLGMGDYLKFLSFMATHGLSLTTISSVVKQLARERTTKGIGWRRASLMDLFQFDVFRHVWRRLQPDFSTFFLNSTAHYQHLFWRDMQPEAFQVKSTERKGEKQHAIRFGYQQMDRLVGRFMKLAGDRATLVFATGLSQQPCLAFEKTGGKRFYRPLDFHKLFAKLGLVGSYKVVPVMSEEFHLYFEKAEDAEASRELLANQHVEGEAVFVIKRQDNELFGGCRIHHNLEGDVRLKAQGSDQDVAFFDYFYKADAVKSGMHHPDGMLWIRQPQGEQRIHETKVALHQIAPTILQLLGIPKPAHMAGESLIESL